MIETNIDFYEGNKEHSKAFDLARHEAGRKAVEASPLMKGYIQTRPNAADGVQPVDILRSRTAEMAQVMSHGQGDERRA